MQKISFYSLLYAFLVFLGGAMAFWYSERTASIIEISVAILLFINCYLLSKSIDWTRFIILLLSIFMIGFYGYFFYSSLSFFFGIMAAISLFFSYLHLIEILKIYTK